MKRRVFITEKFALLNILKALEGLSPKPEGEGAKAEDSVEKSKPQPAASNENKADSPNVMLSVLERHERISNRVRYGANSGKK